MANEIELKLRIDESNASLLNHHPAITDRLIEQPWTRKLVSIYYDTPNFTLLDAGLNLRVRSMSGGWFQAIKSTGQSIGGLHQRLEWEDLLSNNEPDFNKITDPHLSNIFADAKLRAALKPIFIVDVVRTDWLLKYPDGSVIEVSVDIGDLKSVTTRVCEHICPIQELEIELKQGKTSHLFELALALQQDIPMSIENGSKAQMGYRYLRPQPLIKTHAQAMNIKRYKQPPTTKQIMQEALTSMQDNQEILKKVNHTPAVYHMKLANNRLASALAYSGYRATDKDTLSIIQDLEWLGQFLNSPCDHFAYQNLNAILNGQRYQRILLSLGAWLHK
ncbi:MAG: inorganic triphosphatase [Candidatus Methylopumilus sp.]|jgi:inorganic triphosphatase YgiF